LLLLLQLKSDQPLLLWLLLWLVGFSQQVLLEVLRQFSTPRQTQQHRQQMQGWWELLRSHRLLGLCWSLPRRAAGVQGNTEQLVALVTSCSRHSSSRQPWRPSLYHQDPWLWQVKKPQRLQDQQTLLLSQQQQAKARSAPAPAQQ
jgi:hypothetical protein